MSDFAKLFKADDTGQVLVLRDQNEEYLPCVVVDFSLPGVGRIATRICFDDDDDGYDKADDAFDLMDEEKALSIARTHILKLNPA